MKKFLASVGDAQLLGQNGQHIADVHTLTESSLSFSTTMEDVRAGTAAKLYGRFSHTTSLTVTMTDAMFDMNYIAYQVGDIDSSTGKPGSIGGKIFETESLIWNPTAKSVTLSYLPTTMGDANGLNKYVVWFKRPDDGDGDYEWHTDVLAASDVSKTFTIDTVKYDEFANLTNTSTVCVRYFRAGGENATTVKIKADFFPAEMVLLLTTKLYAGSASNIEAGKEVGNITIKIPRFQLDGSFDLSMAMTSAASLSLSGSALAVADGSDCEGAGVYAEIVSVETTDDEYANLTGLVFSADEYNKGDTVSVFGIYGGTQAAPIDNSVIIFGEINGTQAISNEDGKHGLVVGIASGSCEMTIGTHKFTDTVALKS